MPQPGMPGSKAEGDDYLIRKIQDLERTVQHLAASNPFLAMGITPVAGGLNVTGNMAISGTLSLPNGIIGNAALSNPVQIGTASNGIGNYAITTTSTVRASVTLTVPAGFTQAVVIANPTAMGYNNTASADYLYVMAVIQGIGGGELYTAAPAGLGVGLAAPFHTTLTGLTGGQTITVSVATRTGTNAWAASTANQANIYATAIYLR
ncbi:hypothetical protein [Pseudarthrobacter sp. N5]|uniref:hypothetical protein n=1 Tax=Pseudarthrobacter sp. N5 TaxID=3418416 RepID=UPI003CF02858